MSGHSTIVIIGAGTAGTTLAARLRRAGARDITVVDPSDQHDYQPLWTLVGGGRASLGAASRPRAATLPRGVRWVRSAVTGVDAQAHTVALSGGSTLSYGQLVVAPGLELDWAGVPGLAETIGTCGTSSNYRGDLAPLTWDLIRGMRSGTAVFSCPATPIKCGGAPQKIAYLAADYWREQGVLGDIDIHLVFGTPSIFKSPHYARLLERVAADYGMTVHLGTEVTAVDGPGRTLTLSDGSSLRYDLAHLVPPQKAPAWIAASGLADASGYCDVDDFTLQHKAFPEIFALGDAASTPASKTGAAVRAQATVVVQNMLAAWQGRDLPGRYDGYSACPIPISRKQMLLCEFDYSLEPKPTLPLLDTRKPFTDYNLFKRVALPRMYWDFMLRGLA